MKWKQMAITSILSLTLTAEAGCMTARPPRPATIRPTILTPADLSLAASIEATVNSDPSLWFANFSASAKDGAVYLTGFVRSDDERLRAIEDARSVPGVTTLRSNIVVMNNDY
jgi:BON domain